MRCHVVVVGRSNAARVVKVAPRNGRVRSGGWKFVGYLAQIRSQIALLGGARPACATKRTGCEGQIGLLGAVVVRKLVWGGWGTRGWRRVTALTLGSCGTLASLLAPLVLESAPPSFARPSVRAEEWALCFQRGVELAVSLYTSLPARVVSRCFCVTCAPPTSGP